MNIAIIDDTITTTICAAARLVGRMNVGSNVRPEAVDDDFRVLADGVATLAATVLDPKFRSNILDWPAMWHSGEYLAARYQLVQLIRRLKNERDSSIAMCGLAEETELMHQSADLVLN